MTRGAAGVHDGRRRTRGAAAGVALAAAGLTAGVVAAVLLTPLPLPITADLRGPGAGEQGPRLVIGEVVGRLALLVPAVLAGLALLLVPARRPVPARLVPVGAAGPVLVLLVAQVNGVRDVGALVLVYAATGGAVLVRSVPGRWPWSVAAVIGIVPWGVIALHQVGALLTGGAVPPDVRLVTAVVLVATVAEFVRGGPGPIRPAPLLVALPPALLAAGSLLI